jgi:hypothetical protein
MGVMGRGSSEISIPSLSAGWSGAGSGEGHGDRSRSSCAVLNEPNDPTLLTDPVEIVLGAGLGLFNSPSALASLSGSSAIRPTPTVFPVIDQVEAILKLDPCFFNPSDGAARDREGEGEEAREASAALAETGNKTSDRFKADRENLGAFRLKLEVDPVGETGPNGNPVSPSLSDPEGDLVLDPAANLGKGGDRGAADPIPTSPHNPLVGVTGDRGGWLKPDDRMEEEETDRILPGLSSYAAAAATAAAFSALVLRLVSLLPDLLLERESERLYSEGGRTIGGARTGRRVDSTLNGFVPFATSNGLVGGTKELTEATEEEEEDLWLLMNEGRNENLLPFFPIGSPSPTGSGRTTPSVFVFATALTPSSSCSVTSCLNGLLLLTGELGALELLAFLAKGARGGSRSSKGKAGAGVGAELGTVDGKSLWSLSCSGNSYGLDAEEEEGGR